MGPGEGAIADWMLFAEKLGSAIAREGLTLLTGGRPVGVMEAALKGCRTSGGTTICVLPGKDKADASKYCDQVIPTGMGNGRNLINILSSDLLVFVGIGPGTISEFGLGLKEKKPMILGPGAQKLWNLAKEMEIPLVVFRTDDIPEILEIIRRNM